MAGLMIWSDISSAGLWRSRRRYGHEAAFARTDEVGVNGRVEVHFDGVGAGPVDWVGAAFTAGSLARFVCPAGAWAEHPMHISVSNAMPAAACACFTGSLLDTGAPPSPGLTRIDHPAVREVVRLAAPARNRESADRNQGAAIAMLARNRIYG